MNVLNAYIITIHPNAFPGCLGIGIINRALEKSQCILNIINLHDFALNKYRSVDDTPFGGGPGMVMRPDVLSRAIDHTITLCENQNYTIIFPTPRSELIFNQNIAKEFTKCNNLIFICGRYEGIDERIFQKYSILSISLGDFILAGGEVAVQVILETIIRLKDNVLGNKNSLNCESFNQNLLEYPQYTQPKVWNDIEVPKILFSGHHANIDAWQQQQAEEVTKKMRPDLWAKYNKKIE